MLIMVGKGIRGGICHSFYWYAKASQKDIKGYDKNKDLSYIQYWDINDFFGWNVGNAFSK